MKYDKVRRNPIQLLSLTGFTVTEFEAIVPTFEYHWTIYYSFFTLKGNPRIRISYNRKTSQLPSINDKLLFVISYFLFEEQSVTRISWNHLRYDTAAM